MMAETRESGAGYLDDRQSDDTVTDPVVVFVTDNGHGLGHLTRLMAVAKQAKGRFQPSFVTLSTGYPLLWDGAVPVEFFPSYAQMGLTKQEWTPLLTMRLIEAIRQTGAGVVVVDHVMPPTTFRDLGRQLPGVRFIWCRRGLWREGRNEEYLAMSSAFDLVVEPGDLAGPIDMGATATQSNGVVRVRPIVLVQPDEYFSREQARSGLGIPVEGRAVLLQFSDSNPDKLRALIAKARDTIAAVAGEEEIHVFAPLHPLHSETLTKVPGVIMAPVYPVARYFRAFDGVISTAGYNSYHEIVISGLPAIFVARDTNSLDDQERRAWFAELSGRAFWVASLDKARFRHSVVRLLATDEPTIAAATARELGAMDGAMQFADLLAKVLEGPPDLTPEDHRLDEDTTRTIRLKLRSGRGNDDSPAAREIALLNAVDHSTPQLDALVSQVTDLQKGQPTLTPVFLIGRASPRALSDGDFVFESVMAAEEWSRVAPEKAYADYLRDRIDEMVDRYAVARAVALSPGASVPEDVLPGGRPDASGGGADRGAGLSARDGLRSFSLRLPSLDRDSSRRISVDLASHLYVPRLLEERGFGGYETSTLACWLAVLSLHDPGAAFDVGANVGPYAWLAAALSDRDVVAFEPVPELLEAVAAVARENHLEIRIEDLALADRNGTAPLYLSDQTDSSNSLVAGFRRSSKAIDVAVRSLDSYIDQTGLVPHMLKIDTETSEPEVLAGGKVTLSSHRPWLIVEVLSGRTEDRLMEILEPFRYFWYPIDDRVPLEQASRIVGDATYEHINWLFAPAQPNDEFWKRLSTWRNALRACGPGS